MTRSAFTVRPFALLLGFVLGCIALSAPVAEAQTLPSQRQIRTYIPPDQLVSFLPSTPFAQFIEFMDPIFERVTGKKVIDPESRGEPIGISIAGMHFLDAFELVLNFKGLTYRETDRFFIVEDIPDQAPLRSLDADEATGRAAPGAVAGPVSELATMATREIQINAILFELNHSRARDLGVDWTVIFGEGGFGVAEATGTDGREPSTADFRLKTDNIFKSLDNFITSPNQVSFSTLAEFFRVLEQEGVGETIANPQVTVQSGEQGRMQVGTDIPFLVRDFAGNTVTQFFSTGIIVDVSPTLIQEPLADTLGSPTFDFIHLRVSVEKSGSRPSVSGPVVDRSTANTQVMLLDGEQTVLGGLYSIEESVARRGIPILKDLPGWFLGLRYVFGRTQRSVTQKELFIVMHARILDPLEVRANSPRKDNLLEESRRKMRERYHRTKQQASTELDNMN